MSERKKAKNQKRSLNILGIRGIPAAHGGFESFVARFAPYLVENGWNVTVYCQHDGGKSNPRRWEDQWRGITRINFETRTTGARATIEFDLISTLDVLKKPGVDLVLGYNTAIFVLLQKIFRRRVAINMDGIEWKRAKWGRFARIWFWLNEWIAGKLASAPICDHPCIVEHVASRGRDGGIMIPYGAERIIVADEKLLEPLSISPGGYFVTIARLEPENSILEIIRAFKMSGVPEKLVVLGSLKELENDYHRQIKLEASEGVIFPGAIYDGSIVQSIRRHCLAYLHGHQVGGTNPSLVEALGAGRPAICHGNRFNKWTTQERQLYFSSIAECSEQFRRLSADKNLVNSLSEASTDVFLELFQLDDIHSAYERVLESLAR